LSAIKKPFHPIPVGLKEKAGIANSPQVARSIAGSQSLNTVQSEALEKAFGE